VRFQNQSASGRLFFERDENGIHESIEPPISSSRFAVLPTCTLKSLALNPNHNLRQLKMCKTQHMTLTIGSGIRAGGIQTQKVRQRLPMIFGGTRNAMFPLPHCPH